MKPPNRYITSKVETLKDTAADGSRTTEAIKWACETGDVTFLVQDCN